MISENIQNLIKKEATLKEEEICGFVLNDNTVSVSKNLAENKSHSFIIDPVDYLSASLKGIKFIFHSHLSATTPSLLDRQSCYNHNIPFIIYSKSEDKFEFLFPDKMKYIGLKFQYNVSDCLSLVANFYKNELNITIRDYFREAGWRKKNPTLILESIHKENFVFVKELNKYDLILFRNEKDLLPSHFGVYLGDNLFLHHPIEGESRIDVYNDIYKKLTYGYLRYKKEDKS